MIRTFMLVALAALSVAPAARADNVQDDGNWTMTRTDVPLSNRWVNAALIAAGGYWGRTPAGCQQVTVYRLVVVRDAGSRSLSSPPVAAAYAGDCQIWVDPAFVAQANYYVDLCPAIVHEVGHLLGYEHADYPQKGDPVDVMASGVDLGVGIPPQCHQRNARKRTNRKWCRHHEPKCEVKYPRLYAASVRSHR